MNNNLFKQILTENVQFILVCDGEQKITCISDIPGIFHSNDSNIKIWNFAIADMDGDDSEEILLEVYGVSRDMGGYIILHKDIDKVYAYKTLNYRTLWFLKEDGSYTYSAWNGSSDGFAQIISFNETGYDEDKYTYTIGDYEGVKEYVVDHKQVSEDEFKKALAEENNKKEIIWHEFNKKNIDLYVKE